MYPLDAIRNLDFQSLNVCLKVELFELNSSALQKVDQIEKFQIFEQKLKINLEPRLAVMLTKIEIYDWHPQLIICITDHFSEFYALIFSDHLRVRWF